MGSETQLPAAVQKQQQDLLDQIAAAEADAQPEAVPAPLPVVEAPVAKVQEPSSEAIKDVSEETYKQKFDVLSGIQRAEGRELRSKIAELEEQLAQPAPVAVEPTPIQVIAPDNSDLTDAYLLAIFGEAQVEDFGLDALRAQRVAARDDMARMLASQQAAPQSTETELQVKQLAEQVLDQQDARFRTDLDNIIPGWVETNTSAEFLEFLGGVEPMSGYTYGDILQDAYSEHESLRAVAIFEAFAASVPTHAAAPSTDSQTMPPTLVSPAVPGVVANGDTAESLLAEKAMLTRRNLTATELMIEDEKLTARFAQLPPDPSQGGGAGNPASFV